MTRGECEDLVAHGIAEASKATTAAGEYAAWNAVVAQRMDVRGKRRRLPRWITQKAKRKLDRVDPVTEVSPLFENGEGEPCCEAGAN